MSDEGLEGNTENFIGKWKKGNPYYTVAESLSEVTPTVVCEAELISDELEYLTEEICKRSVGGMT